MKRLFDFVFALFFLILLTPLFFIVGFFIFIYDQGPVFYKQKRVGKNLTEINILKFRSMTNKIRVVHTQIDNNSLEVTPIGRFIRRLKIDELPQLINVLLGDLSLVGPRPCLRETLKEFGVEKSSIRHSVRPGLTGLAQVNGNIHLSWQERLIYDLQYVRSHSLIIDMKIIFRTFIIVILGERWGKDR